MIKGTNEELNMFFAMVVGFILVLFIAAYSNYSYRERTFNIPCHEQGGYVMVQRYEDLCIKDGRIINQEIKAMNIK